MLFKIKEMRYFVHWKRGKLILCDHRSDIIDCQCDQNSGKEAFFIHDKSACLLFVYVIIINSVYQLKGYSEHLL